jgi:uncharacterized protein (DUF1501 family)
MYGLAIGAGLPFVLNRTARDAGRAGTGRHEHREASERILVVIELSGGNDGLNTVVPFGMLRITRRGRSSGLPSARSSRLPTASGSILDGRFRALYKDGALAVVHGCGYEHPSLSHFSSMGYWHTGVPNGGESLGWLGRVADEALSPAQRNLIVNLGTSQSLAVRSRQHSPLVFDDPARFRREGTDTEKQTLAR